MWMPQPWRCHKGRPEFIGQTNAAKRYRRADPVPRSLAYDTTSITTQLEPCTNWWPKTSHNVCRAASPPKSSHSDASNCSRCLLLWSNLDNTAQQLASSDTRLASQQHRAGKTHINNRTKMKRPEGFARIVLAMRHRVGQVDVAVARRSPIPEKATFSAGGVATSVFHKCSATGENVDVR